MVKIGDIELNDFPLLLAPMEDVSDPPFRALCKEHGADVVYTEFISSEGLIRDAAKSVMKLDIYEKERPVGIQIFGANEESMLRASDHEIFLRELISNATDATLKLKHLSNLGESIGELGDPIIEIKLDKENKTLHIIDQGIGMTSEEVKKYINQVAFSGAEEFLEKYKDNDTQYSEAIKA